MRYLATMLLLFCCASAFADDAGERTALAQRLTELLDVKGANLDANTCTKAPAETAKFIREQYAKRPDEFYGVSPQSVYWPEVEEIYRTFYGAVCASRMVSAVESAHVAAFAAMSVADLHAAIAFYSSSTGQQMQVVMKKMLPELNALMNRGVDDDVRAAQDAFLVSMVQLKKRYAAEPK